MMRLKDNFTGAVAAAAAVLRGGGVIALPTDTVYGLAVVAGCAQAEATLRALKERGDTQPFQRLLGNAADVAKLGAIMTPAAQRLMACFWPGALTLVLPLTGGGTVGVRLPDSAFVVALVESLQRPLVATSANRSGAAPLRCAAAVAKMFAERVGLVLDAGELPESPASTVVDVTQEEVQVLRVGSITRAAIMACVADAPDDNSNG